MRTSLKGNRGPSEDLGPKIAGGIATVRHRFICRPYGRCRPRFTPARKERIMKYRSLVSSALVALAVLTATPAYADNMVSIGITPATGAVTLVPRWGIGGNLAGFHHMSQDLGLGGAANNFYSIKATPIPAGGDILAFNLYSAGSGAA